MRKKIFSIFALGALLLTASCSLHDDNEIFDTPAAQRMEETIAKDKALLESATNGWKLVLWMGEDYSAGGYTYFLKFANDKVTAGADIANPSDWTTNSSYDVIADEGPVLTINTYNQIFHYLANPESDGSQVEQDYEFIITRTTNDSIYLTGKKYGNKMVMTRVADGVSWADEIDKIKAMEGSLMYTFKLCNGSDSIGSVELSASRVMDVEVADLSESIPYCITAEGISLQRPITVNGQSVQNLRYDADAMTFTPLDQTAASLNLQILLPDNYMYYAEFEGTYTLYYGSRGTSRIRNIQLTPAGDGITYNITGLVRNATITAIYRKGAGGLRIETPQMVGFSGSTYYYMLPWALADGGSVYFSSGSFGLDLLKNTAAEGTELVFEDFSGYNIDSFIMGGFSVSDPSTLTNSSFTGWGTSNYFGNGSYQLAYLTRMVKTN